MYYTVYKTTNITNGKSYIGQHKTSDLDDGYLGSGFALKRAIKKYGSDAFVKEYLFIFDNEKDMNDKEIELVTLDFCMREDTYNICPGGNSGGVVYANLNGLNHKNSCFKSEEWQKILQEKAKEGIKKKHSDLEWKEDYYKRISETKKKFYQVNPGGFEGRTHSDETKKKMSETKKNKTNGDKNSQYGTMWITNGLENKKIRKDDDIPTGFRKGRVCK